MSLIIDCHGHYTTAPKALEAWRNQQIAGINNPSARPKVSDLKITESSFAKYRSGRIPDSSVDERIDQPVSGTNFASRSRCSDEKANSVTLRAIVVSVADYGTSTPASSAKTSQCRACG